MVKSKALRSSNTEHPEVVKLDLKIQQLEAELETAKRKRIKLCTATGYNYDENILALKKLMDEESRIADEFTNIEITATVVVSCDLPPIDATRETAVIEDVTLVSEAEIADKVRREWLPITQQARKLAREISDKSGVSCHNVFRDALSASYPSEQ